MNAAVVHSFDKPPRYTPFEEPTPTGTEVLVDVIAAGLHPVVKSLASGTHYGSTGKLPFIPGVDGVGRRQDGTQIYFGMSRIPFGTFAERSVASPGLFVPIPQGLDAVKAAGMANPAMSSWVALTMRGKFVAGENVLILGATGVAGQLAVQIAKHLGARRIVAAGRNREALESLKELGTDAIIALDQDHEPLVSSIRREWTEYGIHVVLDYLWGYPAEAVLEAISLKGFKQATSNMRFVQIGESAGSTISLPAATLRSSPLELLGSGFGSAKMDEIIRALAEFLQLAARSSFKINIKPVPLRDVEALWNASERGERLVFVP